MGFCNRKETFPINEQAQEGFAHILFKEHTLATESLFSCEYTRLESTVTVSSRSDFSGHTAC